jgi:hypothetical protein
MPIYKNRTVKSIEIVLRRGGVGRGEGTEG